MPWYAPWSNVIKKKVCRFLLQRYLGQFLEERLSLDQLTVDFYNGTGTVYDVTLYCQVSSGFSLIEFLSVNSKSLVTTIVYFFSILRQLVQF